MPRAAAVRRSCYLRRQRSPAGDCRLRSTVSTCVPWSYRRIPELTGSQTGVRGNGDGRGGSELRAMSKLPTWPASRAYWLRESDRRRPLSVIGQRLASVTLVQPSRRRRPSAAPVRPRFPVPPFVRPVPPQPPPLPSGFPRTDPPLRVTNQVRYRGVVTKADKDGLRAQQDAEAIRDSPLDSHGEPQHVACRRTTAIHQRQRM